MSFSIAGNNAVPLLGQQGERTDSSRPQYLDRRRSVPKNLASWEFPGWGTVTHLQADEQAIKRFGPDVDQAHEKLGEWSATAICGNDITSSCLYVSGLVTLSAGKLAPICLIIVAVLLYLLRGIYGEAVTALPMNGGCYSVLINTTSKRVASMVACLSILSYIATGVVSATDAILYLQAFLELPTIGLTFGEADVVVGAFVLLLFFATLCFFGMSESAGVAVSMFIFHMTTLVILCISSLVWACNDGFSTFKHNMDLPLTTGMSDPGRTGTVVTAIIFGFSSSLLGISGFESSSQFVEEQQKGVFVKTLRNMWVSVAIFNPLISILSLCLLPLDEFTEETSRTMLAEMGSIAAGDWLQILVSLDAFIVLSGAVLTAYVGVTGLIRRMARDRCLPQVLLKTNSWRGTNHVIIFGFFTLSSLLLFATQVSVFFGGDRVTVDTLAGVYCFAFLGLLFCFTVGCMLLKYKRPMLPRDVHTSWGAIAATVVCVIVGLAGNLVAKQDALLYFFAYLFGVVSVVGFMFNRVFLLKLLRHVPCIKSSGLERSITEINTPRVIFFLKHDDLVVLNKAILYVKDNEQTARLSVVHVYEPEVGVPPRLAEHIEVLDSLYPKLQVSLLCVKGTFSPALCRWVGEQLCVDSNMCFITCPDDQFPHNVADLKMRVITTVPHRKLMEHVGSPTHTRQQRVLSSAPAKVAQQEAKTAAPGLLFPGDSNRTQSA